MIFKLKNKVAKQFSKQEFLIFLKRKTIIFLAHLKLPLDFFSLTWQTVTNELINTILTAATVFARIRFAFIDITQTPCIVITARAFTTETIHQVDAYAAICTRIRRALIYISLTVNTRETRYTFTCVSRKEIKLPVLNKFFKNVFTLYIHVAKICKNN